MKLRGHLNRNVEGTIFGTRNIIFHSARDRKSVLISVCETHLQFMQEMVQAEGKNTRTLTQSQKTRTAVFVSVDKTVLGDGERRRGETVREREGDEREREMKREIREGKRWREAEG